MVVRTLRDLFHLVGALVMVEHRVTDMVRQRPDLQILFPDRTLMIDVTVTHPTSPSRSSSRPLTAASDAEAKKIRDYSALATQHGAVFIPFALESYGAFGKRAQEVMKILLSAAKNSASSLPVSIGRFVAYATQRVAITLQRGNAAIARRGAVQARMKVVKERR